MNISCYVKITIKHYFDMNKEERKYIEGLLDDKKAKWTKKQLIIALLIFIVRKHISLKKLEELELYIEDNIKVISNLIDKFEKEFKSNLK